MVDAGGRRRRRRRARAGPCRGDVGIAPSRTCVGCRAVAPPDRLVRVVATPGGGLAVGRTLPGRGAWVCAGSDACVAAAARGKAFDRALRTTIGKEAVDELRSTLASRGRLGS
ncbi:MAG TPA: YlxR family protein [Acidimicrobiales bacterium]|nr:YlxR family protein [Acidimicrobiales bacterium]